MDQAAAHGGAVQAGYAALAHPGDLGGPGVGVEGVGLLYHLRQIALGEQAVDVFAQGPPGYLADVAGAGDPPEEISGQAASVQADTLRYQLRGSEETLVLQTVPVVGLYLPPVELQQPVAGVGQQGSVHLAVGGAEGHAGIGLVKLSPQDVGYHLLHPHIGLAIHLDILAVPPAAPDGVVVVGGPDGVPPELLQLPVIHPQVLEDGVQLVVPGAHGHLENRVGRIHGHSDSVAGSLARVDMGAGDTVIPHPGVHPGNETHLDRQGDLAAVADEGAPLGEPGDVHDDLAVAPGDLAGLLVGEDPPSLEAGVQAAVGLDGSLLLGPGEPSELAVVPQILQPQDITLVLPWEAVPQGGDGAVHDVLTDTREITRGCELDAHF